MTRRYEPAGFPRLGGNSDVGFEFGAVGTLSYFANNIRPYAWNMDLAAWVSFKGGPNGGTEIAQQSIQWNLDQPGLLGGLLRITPQVAYTRTINEGYFGLGNDSPAAIPRLATDPGRFHEYIQRLLQVTGGARVEVEAPYYWMSQVDFRYVVPDTYDGSELAADAQARKTDGAPVLWGTGPLSLLGLATGLVYDSRDDEIFTTTGEYHQIGVRFEQGIPFSDQVRYAEIGIILSGFTPLTRSLVLAGRLVADFQFGNVPFYDLYVAGPFQLKDLPGGSTGVRGVPIGRYLGPIKAVANVELRSLFTHFTVFKQKITFGGDLFADTGRVWSDYSFQSPLDGSGLGLKWGTGLGMYWLWGQAAIFRVEMAYSPDATSQNEGFPFGLYLEDGTMF